MPYVSLCLLFKFRDRRIKIANETRARRINFASRVTRPYDLSTFATVANLGGVVKEHVKLAETIYSNTTVCLTDARDLLKSWNELRYQFDYQVDY